MSKECICCGKHFRAQDQSKERPDKGRLNPLHDWTTGTDCVDSNFNDHHYSSGPCFKGSTNRAGNATAPRQSDSLRHSHNKIELHNIHGHTQPRGRIRTHSGIGFAVKKQSIGYAASS